VKHYWWQRIMTESCIGGHRLVQEYEVCNDGETGQQYYTGNSRYAYA
jgi:hypothetical protein